jgi:hypothetical protein
MLSLSSDSCRFRECGMALMWKLGLPVPRGFKGKGNPRFAGHGPFQAEMRALVSTRYAARRVFWSVLWRTWSALRPQFAKQLPRTW